MFNRAAGMAACFSSIYCRTCSTDRRETDVNLSKLLQFQGALAQKFAVFLYFSKKYLRQRDMARSSRFSMLLRDYSFRRNLAIRRWVGQFVESLPKSRGLLSAKPF